MMTYKGLVKGTSLELQEALPFPEGEVVNVSIEPVDQRGGLDGASAIRNAMHDSPHLEPADVDELVRAIEEGKLPVHQENVFGVDAD